MSNGRQDGPCKRGCCWNQFGVCPRDYTCNHPRSYLAGQDFNQLAASANAETVRAQNIPKVLTRKNQEGN